MLATLSKTPNALALVVLLSGTLVALPGTAWSAPPTPGQAAATPQEAAEQEAAEQEAVEQEAVEQEAAEQEAAEELLSAREVIDRYVEAIGGEEAVRAHTSQHLVGTVELAGQGITGSLEVWAMAPDKLLIEIELPGLGLTRNGYDGEVGWLISPAMGPMVLEGDMLAEMQAEADYYSELHKEEDYASMETVAKVDFEGRPAYKLELVRTSGQAAFEYYDAATGLLLGRESEQQSPMGAMKVVTTVGEWEWASGLRIPTRSTQSMPTGQELVTTVSEIEFDAVDPAVFELPQEIVTLLESEEAAAPEEPEERPET